MKNHRKKSLIKSRLRLKDILPVMMKAMKFYLFFPVLFLIFLSSPLSGFSQENDHSHQKTETSTDLPISHEHQIEEEWRNFVDHNDIPGVNKEHLPHESETFQTKFFNMLFILGLLIGFMILASWALKRMMKSKMTQMNTSSSIKLLETRYLSPRATLYLVEIHDETFLIAESPTTVTYLATLPLKEESVIQDEQKL
jgi:flagellar biogenesis protein FliO